MLKFYAHTMLISLLLFAVLSVAMLAIGSAQPLNPALRGFVEGCEGAESLCWYGIVSGETPIETTHEILSRDGFSVTNQTQLNLHFYERLTQEGCNEVQLAYNPDEPNPQVTIARLNNVSFA